MVAMRLEKLLILRRSRSGRLEGRTALAQPTADLIIAACSGGGTLAGALLGFPQCLSARPSSRKRRQEKHSVSGEEHMKFGLFGSAQARRAGPDTDSSQGFRDFIDNNVEAEALGYYSTFLVEHHFTGFGQVSASLNLLTWLGARTRHLRLGTAVIVLPWHNPILLAEQAATLDLLSGGRLDFGVGRGYRHNEFAGFRIPMEEADARYEEALEVITRAWTSDVPFTHHGEY